jgi:two-component system chemotaxis sensor kinase CheA
MTTLLERFIPEAREQLEGAAAGLLKLERDPSDAGLVNEVFRAVHTLKGASGLFDVPGLTRLLHAGEDLLGAARESMLTMDPAIVDALLDGLDLVSAWVDELERHGRLPDDADGVSVDLSRRLRAFLPDADNRNVNGMATDDAPADPASRADWLADLPEADRLVAFAETVAGGPALLAVSYAPDDGCFYRGEDPFNLFPQLPGLRSLQIFCRLPIVALAETDPFRSALAFRALVAQPRAEVEHLFRYVIDQVIIAAVPPEALILPAGDLVNGRIDPEPAEHARQSLGARDFAGLRIAVAALLAQTDAHLWVASGLRWFDAILAAPLPNAAWASAMLAAIAEVDASPIGDAKAPSIFAPKVEHRAAPAASSDNPMAARILAEQLRIVAMPGNPAMRHRRMVAVEATVGSLLSSLDWSLQEGELAAATADAVAGTPEKLLALISELGKRAAAIAAGPAPVHAVAPTLPATGPTPDAARDAARDATPDAAPDAARDATQPTTGAATQTAHVLKVDQAKVDALMNLIAELVVSKNSLPFLAKRAEEVYGSREMGREIKDQYAVIDRLAQEMQRAIMAVRMLPVSVVFERFPRLVRDLSRKLNKHIELRIVGEDTAADKTIIESLGDPLIHLVRNAIDHGVESPEQRAAAGKPEAATIQLKAFQEGDQVVIEVSDDGKGIDPMAIRLKAFEKGMVTEEKVDTLSDQAAINMIFLPGFSTVEAVSDLSGRGVGMDVVRTAVEKINGQVTLSSRKGEGTLVRLSLPLSMAVARVMMIEVGGALFGVPMDGVAETVRVSRQDIRWIKRAEAFVLRDAIVPLVRMHTLLGLPRAAVEVEHEAVLVARVRGAAVGLVVDRLREGIDVVLKPLDGILAGTRGYSGAALLGDGRVLLVLNLKELL